MKNYLFILISYMSCAFSVYADNISVADVTLNNDQVGTVSIVLNNTSSSIVATQFNIALPEGIEPVMENGKVIITASDRISGEYVLRGSKVANGCYLFIFLSKNRTPIIGNSGTLFSFKIKNVSAKDGQHSAALSDITITDINGSETVLDNASTNINVQCNYTSGDVNNDGKVTIADVSVLISYLKQGNPSTFNLIAADMNNDKKINLKDLELLLTLILNKRNNQ